MPIKTIYLHRKPPQLGYHIIASGEFSHRLIPLKKNRCGLIAVWTNTQRATQMVQHDESLRKPASEMDDFMQLRVVTPRLER